MLGRFFEIIPSFVSPFAEAFRVLAPMELHQISFRRALEKGTQWQHALFILMRMPAVDGISAGSVLS